MPKAKIHAGKSIQAFENYLAAVAMMYYGDPYVSKKTESAQSSRFRQGKRPRNHLQMDPLAFLVSPLRQEFIFGIFYLENWTPKQIAIFECSMCSFGKQFMLIERLLKSAKTYQDISQFYNM